MNVLNAKDPVSLRWIQIRSNFYSVNTNYIVVHSMVLFVVQPLFWHILTFCFFPLLQSMVAFLKDPSGPPLWEENPEAKDVIHVETEKVSNDLDELFKDFGLGFKILKQHLLRCYTGFQQQWS